MGFLKRLFGRDKAQREPPKPPEPPKPRVVSKPDFPLGENLIDDPDVKTVQDLVHHYPLPQGFEYRETTEGVPLVVRVADGKEFSFLIEEGMLTFNERYVRENGKVGYKTTEVIKLGLR